MNLAKKKAAKRAVVKKEVSASAVSAKKKSFGAKIKSEFTTTAIVMIPIAIAINQVGRLISTSLGLPLFLDTIGTIFTAMLCGPWVAGVGGFLTNVVTAIIYGRPTSVFFGIVQLMIGLIAGLFIWKNWIKKWYMVLVFGVVIAFTSAITSAFISAGVSGGLSGTGTDLVIAYFLKTGTNFWTSIITARIITESFDKIFSGFVAWISVKRLPEKYARLFKYAKNVR